MTLVPYVSGSSERFPLYPGTLLTMFISSYTYEATKMNMGLRRDAHLPIYLHRSRQPAGTARVDPRGTPRSGRCDGRVAEQLHRQ